MQPQGHVQVLSNMLNFGMDPQSAVDACRFMIDLPSIDEDDRLSPVALETGIPDSVIEELRKYGHRIQVYSKFQRASLGRGQIIQMRESHGRRVYWAGSEPRCDGCAMGW
jgi:gamma-glutamyltranspeptidase/glutathione hydrolase